MTWTEYPEEWKPVVGYENRYEVSNWGKIRNKKTGKLMAVNRIGRRHTQVSLWREDLGKQKMHCIKTLVWTAFKGPIPEGYRVATVSDSVLDCSISNLKLVSWSEWGRKIGASSGKPVIKINKDGKVVGVYRSATEAGKKNGYVRSNMHIRCGSSKVVGPACDGCDYAYEDDWDSVRRALKRLGINNKEWAKKNGYN